ncbi:Cytochrome P450 4V2 [Frankliniella fusca]|uniref:Cytochrome P450 4V2 n=1 Tax=Frankliniella fusca TaxID=407009 RepID=A0AAE1LSH9_9NEOP|nr:Cytochrome P450 4V2 [Frankliniella fusca]
MPQSCTAQDISSSSSPSMAALTTLALLAGCLALLLLAPWARRLVRHLLRVGRQVYLTLDVPGPACLPLLGTLPAFLRFWEDMEGTLLDLVAEYGPTVRFRMVDRVALLVMHPDDVQAVITYLFLFSCTAFGYTAPGCARQAVCTHPALVNKADQLVRSLRPFTGDGLLLLNGREHRAHRKAISPSLHFDILRDFVAVFDKNSRALAERLGKHADDGRVFDVHREFGKLTSTTLQETVLSLSEDQGEGKAGDVFNVVGDLALYRGMRPWWQNDTVFRLLSPHYEQHKRAEEDMDTLVLRVLAARRAQVSRGGAPAPPRRRMAFLDHVLRSEEAHAMSEAELRAELKTLLFAGSATSMDFLSYLTVVLTILPDVQARLQQEVDGVFGAPGSPGADRPLLPEDLVHLDFLERVVKEALRLAPPVPMLFRQASSDVTLPRGVFVPEGTVVILVPAGTHRMPSVFPEPLRFDPDRFLPERSQGRHPYSFLPFSAGPRNCVGFRYALMFVKTAVANLMRSYTFVPPPSGAPRTLQELHRRMQPGATMTIKGGALVRLARRAPGS